MRLARLAVVALVLLAGGDGVLAAPKDGSCEAVPRGNAWGYWERCGAASATLGVEGGTVETPAGASVTLPFGAVDAPFTVTVEATTLAPPPEVGAVSPVYRFGPEGTVFAKPVTVSLPLPPGVTQASIYWSRLGSTELEPIGGTIAGGFITAETPHFSLAVVGAESAVRTVSGVGQTTFVSATSRETVRQDFAAIPAEAIVRDAAGNLVAIAAVPGAGEALGTFTIPDVPAGEYVLHSGNQYLVTSSNAPDLGTVRGGRPDTTPLETSAHVELNLTNLAPWRAGSSLELFSTEVDAWDFDTERFPLGEDPPLLAEGQTALTFWFDFAHLGGVSTPPSLIEGSRGDRLYLAQLAAATSANGVPYTAMARLVQFEPFDLVPGGVVPLTGAMLDVARGKTIAVDFRASAFKAAVLADANPNAVLDCDNTCGGFFGVLAQAGTSADGFYTSNADLLLLNERLGEDLVTGEMSYGSPENAGLVGAWGEIGHVRWNGGVFYALPGLLPTWSAVSNGLAWTADVAKLAAPTALVPRISFARNLRIDGESFFADRTLSTPTPAVSWEPPAIGVPTHYELNVSELVPTPNGLRTRLQRGVARIVTPNTSFTLLPGTLQPGHVYVFSVTAFDAPAAVNAPFRTVLDSASATATSGVLSAPAQ